MNIISSLIERGISIYSISQTALNEYTCPSKKTGVQKVMGQMLVSIMTAFAEMERETTRARCQLGQKALREKVGRIILAPNHKSNDGLYITEHMIIEALIKRAVYGDPYIDTLLSMIPNDIKTSRQFANNYEFWEEKAYRLMYNIRARIMKNPDLRVEIRKHASEGNSYHLFTDDLSLKAADQKNEKRNRRAFPKAKAGVPEVGS